MSIQKHFNFVVSNTKTKFWDKICHAHALLRFEGKAHEALPIFLSSLNINLKRLFGETGTQNILPMPNSFSLNWYCEYLAGYCYIRRGVWQVWLDLFERVKAHPYFDYLPLAHRSMLMSHYGWAILRTQGTRANRSMIYSMQVQLLKQVDSTSTSAALHHILLAHLARQNRDGATANYHHQASLSILTLDDEPFYYLFAREMKASTAYFLRNTDEGGKQAIEEYQAIKIIAQSLNDGYDIREQDYNVGWVKSELRSFSLDSALNTFRNGEQACLVQPDKRYEIGMYAYGMSYVFLQMKDYVSAMQLLDKAIGLLVSQSPLLVASCLQLKAAIAQRQNNYDAAREYANDGLYQISLGFDVTQLYHLHRRLTELYFSPKYLHRFIYHLFHTYQLKLALGKPLLRF